MHYLYLFSVWLHILAAMVWIGGAAFIALVLVPALRRPEFAAVFSSVLRRSVLRFRFIGWVCLAILVITGLANLALRGFPLWGLLDGSLFQGSFGRILAVKLLLVGFILFISAIHDFFLGPRAVTIILNDPDSAEAKKARKTASLMGRITLLAGLAVTALAVALVRGWPA